MKKWRKWKKWKKWKRNQQSPKAIVHSQLDWFASSVDQKNFLTNHQLKETKCNRTSDEQDTYSLFYDTMTTMYYHHPGQTYFLSLWAILFTIHIWISFCCCCVNVTEWRVQFLPTRVGHDLFLAAWRLKCVVHTIGQQMKVDEYRWRNDDMTIWRHDDGR